MEVIEIVKVFGIFWI